MIVVRDSSGDIKPVAEDGFIEILSDDGKICVLIYNDDKAIKVIQSTDPEAEFYSKRFGVEFARGIHIDK